MNWNPNAKFLKIVDLQDERILTHTVQACELFLKQDRYELPENVELGADAPQSTIQALDDACCFNRGEMPEPVSEVDELAETASNDVNSDPLSVQSVNETENQVETTPEKTFDDETDDQMNQVNEDRQHRIDILVETKKLKDLKKYANELEVDTKGLRTKKDFAVAIVDA